jgi:hypothetical protein
VEQNIDLEEPPVVEPVTGNERAEPVNPYENSTAVQILKERKQNQQPLRVAFFDIDSTITGDTESTNEVRKQLESLGYVVCMVTSRTEEMVITENKREQSPTIARPKPHLGKDDSQNRIYVDPGTIEPAGVLNAHIVAGSTGSGGQLIEQIDGSYIRDSRFEAKMKAESDAWRSGVTKLIEFVNNDEQLCQLIPIESVEKYDEGETDVYPPNFRIQVDFPTISAKQRFQEKVLELKQANRNDLFELGLDASAIENLFNVRITDDSKPKGEKYSAYLTPAKGNKMRAEEEIVNNICDQVGIKRNELDLLIAGDSFPDLGMGLYGGLGTHATFILAGGSRLTDDLTRPSLHGEDITFAGEGLNAIRRRLKPDADKPGYYTFRQPGILNVPAHDQPIHDRTVVILDEVFPGKVTSDSILSYLQSSHETA